MIHIGFLFYKNAFFSRQFSEMYSRKEKKKKEEREKWVCMNICVMHIVLHEVTFRVHLLLSMSTTESCFHRPLLLYNTSIILLRRLCSVILPCGKSLTYLNSIAFWLAREKRDEKRGVWSICLIVSVTTNCSVIFHIVPLPLVSLLLSRRRNYRLPRGQIPDDLRTENENWDWRARARASTRVHERIAR